MPDMPLSIGSVVGGWAPAWEEAVDQLSDAVVQARAGRSGGIDLNVVFIIAGNAYRPDFEGIRLGRYSRASKTLLVEVALLEVADSTSDPTTYVRSQLREALVLAQGWAEGKGLANDLSEAAAVVDEIVPPSISVDARAGAPVEPVSGDDQLTVVIPLSGEGSGTPDERELVLEIEEELIKALERGSGGEVNGHEFGGGTATIQLWGASADDLGDVIVAVLRGLELPKGTFVLSESHRRTEVERIDL